MRPFRLVLAVGLLGVAAAPPTLAEPPSPASASPSARSIPDLPQRLLDELRRGVPTASASTGLPPLPSGVPAILPSPSAGASASLTQALQLAQRWRELEETRAERRERRRAVLIHQLGARLAEPKVRAELQLHATRVAELQRLRFLAQHARSGSEQRKLLERIDALTQREARRHRKALSLLGAPAAAAGASGAPR